MSDKYAQMKKKISDAILLISEKEGFDICMMSFVLVDTHAISTWMTKQIDDKTQTVYHAQALVDALDTCATGIQKNIDDSKIAGITEA